MNITGAEGDIVTITGENLYNTLRSAVYFNSPTGFNRVIPIAGSFSGDALFKFKIPGSLPRNNTVYYDNSADTEILFGINLVVIGKPTIESIIPPTGYWRDTVTLYGENFIGIKNISIGGARVTEYFVDSENSVRILIPDGSVTSDVSISATGGNTTSFSLGGGSSLRVHKPDSRVLSFFPTSGKYGDVITLSGVSLDAVKRVIFSGVYSENVVEDFSIFGTTGISLRLPAGTATNKKLSLRFTKSSALSNSPLGSSEPDQNLTILNEYISYVSPTAGLFGDSVIVSGNKFSSSSFFFEGFNTGDRTFIPPLFVNVINNNLAEIGVPKNIILGKLLISGFEKSESKEKFLPIPIVSGFENSSLQAGGAFSLVGVNISECYPALFISDENSQSHHIIANRDTQSARSLLFNDSDVDAESKYFGGIRLDLSELLTNYPESLTTGNMRLTGIINANYFGRGKAFLVGVSEFAHSQEPASPYEYISLLNSYSLSFPLGKSRLEELSKDVEISGKKPSVIGLSLDRIGETGSLFISGNYFIGMTGIRFTDGASDGRISLSQAVPFFDNYRIAAVETGREANIYEKTHVVAVNIQDFNYTGKSGVFLLAAPYYEWV